jgi:hypothetical protein
MKIFLACLMLILLSLPREAETLNVGLPQKDEIQTVDYCELIHNPQKYDQKTVRVRAIYRYGYEWSELYCPNYIDQNRRTWVNPKSLDESCIKAKVANQLKDSSFKGRTLRVVMVGKFHGSGGSYGHLNAYQFQFDARCIEEAKTLLKDSRLPTSMSKKLLDKISSQAKP